MRSVDGNEVEVTIMITIIHFQPGSYGTRVYSTDTTNAYKMYNESCDLMDRREGQDVPVFIKLSELSKEGVGQKAHLELLSVSSYNLEVVSFQTFPHQKHRTSLTSGI